MWYGIFLKECSTNLVTSREMVQLPYRYHNLPSPRVTLLHLNSLQVEEMWYGIFFTSREMLQLPYRYHNLPSPWVTLLHLNSLHVEEMWYGIFFTSREMLQLPYRYLNIPSPWVTLHLNSLHVLWYILLRMFN